MPYIHPQTWEQGIMPLEAFPAEKRAEIAEAVARPTPPPKWIKVVGGQIQSRAWWEWHWERGKKLRYIHDPIKRRWIRPSLRQAVYDRDGNSRKGARV